MSDTSAAAPSIRSAVRNARRVAIVSIIVSLVLAAIIGISIILAPGDFSDVQGQVLLTTLALAGFAITSLCHLAVVGKALQAIGYVGIAASALAFVAAGALIWSDWGSGSDMSEWWRAFGIFNVLAISFAHSNLLLLLGARRRPAIRAGLFATLAAIALVALMLILPIFTDGDIPGDAGEGYWRFFAVLAILDVLGTIVLPVASIFLRDEQTASPAGATQHPAAPGYEAPTPDVGAQVLTIDLPLELAARLAAVAAASGQTREQAAILALDRSIAVPPAPLTDSTGG